MRPNWSAREGNVMMRFSRTLTLCAALGPLASCVTTSPANDCAGWRQITGESASVEWLAANDPQFLRAVIGHNETGQARRCW